MMKPVKYENVAPLLEMIKKLIKFLQSMKPMMAPSTHRVL